MVLPCLNKLYVYVFVTAACGAPLAERRRKLKRANFYKEMPAKRQGLSLAYYISGIQIERRGFFSCLNEKIAKV